MNWQVYTHPSGYREWYVHFPYMTITIEEWSRPKGSSCFTKSTSREEDEKKGYEFGYTALGSLNYFKTPEEAKEHTRMYLRAVLRELQLILDGKPLL
jgi:hypothetical protein